ncbi:MAG: hypothetical protein ACLGJC_09510 [Alphaproteobacteria bacterium]
MTTANPLIVAALRDNTGLIRAHGAALKDDPDLWGRYQRNRDLIASEQVKAAAKRKEVAA